MGPDQASSSLQLAEVSKKSWHVGRDSLVIWNEVAVHGSLDRILQADSIAASENATKRRRIKGFVK